MGDDSSAALSSALHALDWMDSLASTWLTIDKDIAQHAACVQAPPELSLQVGCVRGMQPPLATCTTDPGLQPLHDSLTSSPSLVCAISI